MTDLILHNGTILTQDSQQPHAEAVAVKNGRIQAVGKWDDIQNLATAGTRKIDLGGRTLIPGFNDAHVHVWKVGHLLTTMLDVRGVSSIPALQASIREFAGRLPADKWFMGRGYNEALMEEKRHPTRHDLDAVLPDRPAYLIRTCAHIVVANSKALELAGVTRDTLPPPGGVIDHDESGEPTGVLHETALGLVFNHIPEPTAKDYEAMLTAAMHHQLELGITSATDPGVLPNLLAVYREMDAGGRLLNRLNVMAIRRPDGGTDTLPLPEPHLSDHLRVDTIKFFADGGLSGATAAVSVPFLVTGGTGVLRFEPDELFELARDAHLQGLRIGIHAIGDRAIEVVLSVYEKLYALAPGQRHRIEHLGLPTPSQLERVSAAGIIAVPQTVFIYSLGPNFRRYVPAEMLPACYPVRDMLDAGITVALSSDAPVVKEDNPLIGLQAAVTRQDFGGETIAANQAITAEEALYAYTMGGAIASGDADNRGSITVGKWADFAILSDNPLRVDSSAISQIKVEMTLVGGQVVYES
jgi:hypothetical protein